MAVRKKRKIELRKILLLAFLLVILVSLVFTTKYAQKPKETKEPEAASLKLYIGGSTGTIKRFNPAILNKLTDFGVKGSTVTSSKSYSGKIYFGFSNGYVTHFNGTTWTSMGNKGNNNGFVDMDVLNNKLYMAQGIGNVFSYDGTNWINVGKPASAVGALKAYNQKLYLGDGGGCYHVYNGGTSWTKKGCFLVYKIESMEVYDNKLIIGDSDPSSGNIYSFDGNGVLKLGEIPGAGVMVLKVYKSKLYVASQKGVIYRYENGKFVNIGNNVTQVNAMSTDGIKLYSSNIYGGVFSYDGTKWLTVADNVVGVNTLEFY
jgi:hypothetical protein